MTESEPQLTDELIKDEEIRERVRRIIRDPSPAWLRELKSISANPLLIAIAVSILTAVVGPFLIASYNDKQRALEHDRVNYELSLKSIQEFSRLVDERYTRSTMLASALKRSAPIEEIRERKKQYDEAFVEWGTNLMANAFMIRNISNEPFYSQFEKYIDDGLTRLFRDIDRNLTRAYDNRVQNRPPRAISECKAPSWSQSGCYEVADLGPDCLPTIEHFRVARGCSTAIANGLFWYVTQKNQLPQEKKDEIDRAIRCNCGL